MDNAEALNQLLSNTCPHDFDGEWKIFRYDLHCLTAEIVARVVGGGYEENGKWVPFQWEIRPLKLF